MVCPQSVKYNSPNRMYIYKKKSGDDAPGHPVTNYIRYTTEISVYSTICASD